MDQLDRIEKNIEVIKEQLGALVSAHVQAKPTTTRVPAKKKSKLVSEGPPTLQDVREYAMYRGRLDLAQRFYDYYTATGWTDQGGKPVFKWKGKFITWEGRNEKPQQGIML